MKITFSTKPTVVDTLVVGAFEGRKLSRSAGDMDKTCKGALTRAMKAGRFTGARDQFLDIVAPSGVTAARIVIAGLGKSGSLDSLGAQNLGGNLVAHLNRVGAKKAAVMIDKWSGAAATTAADQAANLGYGARLRGYRFDKYRTKEKPDKKPTLARLTLVVSGARAAAVSFNRFDRIADGVFMTRDLVSEPANVIYPQSLAARAKSLTKLGVTVEVLTEARMAKLGMGALLGVGQGSDRDSYMVVMRWNGAPKSSKKPPIAFVGKGVTFDTGGISIKPSGGMEDMKWDMGGAGVVIGLLAALAGRKAKVDVVGVVGLVENMPSSTAQRPGDVVNSMSGQTIEVINTDAEGRLVLADVLCYCQKRFKPRLMIDLATLTGAIIVALGHEHAGLFSNDDKLAEQIGAAGKKVGETVWRLPLGEAYDEQINSPIADMKNVGSGRGGGSITAAQFLKRFVDDTPWAHLDIAGVAWAKKDAACVPKGGTGFGVRLLDRFVADNFE
ncbi:MAG: leucyl aminopeptidase [Proteobacteria bacterium]|nr:leucyl aminopeptidase [Pseudomonadota bacterium]